jgi:hypothetical protein
MGCLTLCGNEIYRKAMVRGVITVAMNALIFVLILILTCLTVNTCLIRIIVFLRGGETDVDEQPKDLWSIKHRLLFSMHSSSQYTQRGGDDQSGIKPPNDGPTPSSEHWQIERLRLVSTTVALLALHFLR